MESTSAGFLSLCQCFFNLLTFNLCLSQSALHTHWCRHHLLTPALTLVLFPKGKIHSKILKSVKIGGVRVTDYHQMAPMKCEEFKVLCTVNIKHKLTHKQGWLVCLSVANVWVVYFSYFWWHQNIFSTVKMELNSQKIILWCHSQTVISESACMYLSKKIHYKKKQMLISSHSL